MKPEDDGHADPEEVPLPGGRLTRDVVRVGDTVRRPRKASSVFVTRLLLLLEQRGFSGAPRHLGVDERDRDILSLASEQRARLVDAMIERQRQNGLFWARQLTAEFTGPDTPPAALVERVAWTERELRFTRANAAVFLAALT